MRLHENLQNDVMVFCLVGQVIDTNELWVAYKCSGGTREVALSAVVSCCLSTSHVSGLLSLEKHFLVLQTLCHKHSTTSFWSRIHSFAAGTYQRQSTKITVFWVLMPL